MIQKVHMIHMIYDDDEEIIVAICGKCRLVHKFYDEIQENEGEVNLSNT